MLLASSGKPCDGRAPGAAAAAIGCWCCRCASAAPGTWKASAGMPLRDVSGCALNTPAGALRSGSCLNLYESLLLLSLLLLSLLLLSLLLLDELLLLLDELELLLSSRAGGATRFGSCLAPCTAWNGPRR